MKNTVILYIWETAILRFCKLKPEFLKNLMGLLSNKVWTMSNKFRILSYDRLKQRIASYLMDQFRYHKDQFTLLQPEKLEGLI